MTTMVTDLAALAAACDPSAINPGPSPLRPLSRLEYDNTVRDLTGLSVSPAPGLAFSHWFPPESRAGIFANDASDAQGRGGDAAFTEAYRKAAEEIAASLEMGGTLLPRCEPAGTSEALCASEFIESFGKHAFRRPLTSEEVTQLEAVFAKGRSGGSYEHGLAAVVAQMLQSQNFLYRVEVGVATPGATAVPLTGYELATRLSYFLSGSMPDAHLLAAADANALSTVEELTAQAQRLLASPAARDAVTEFHRQWLAWDGISLVQKDATAFPTWTPQLAGDLVTEAVAFGSDVFWNDGRLTTFFTAPYSFVNGALARHYGLSGSFGDGAFVKVALDPRQRSGILTLGAFLGQFANQKMSNPVGRGNYIRERLLCTQVPPEPPNTQLPLLPPLPPGATTRQRFEALDSGLGCVPCHDLMDPLGFGLENFDAVGKWREKDGDFQVDASGEVVGAIDATTNGSFQGPVELAQKLASSGDVRACVAAQWFRWANGRKPTLPDDACSLLTINKRFEAADYDMRVLPLAIIATDAFRYRSATTP